MKICVIGTGYVGLVTAACLANTGHTVSCSDSDANRIACLKSGNIPFYEPGLSELVIKSVSEQTLFFHTETREAIKNAEICIIAVGTPPSEDGSANLEYIESAAKDTGRYITGDIIAVVKSTVPPGTSARVMEWICAETEKRGVKYNVSVASNPEFLKEGNAVADFGRPDRILIGSNDEKTVCALKEMYSTFNQKTDRILVMSAESAELAKYASNAMLATRISFMNEIAALCEKTGANVNDVRIAMGADERIGPSFLYAGCGYGGSCFPKDVLSLISIQKQNGLKSAILTAVNDVNERQKHALFKKVLKHFNGDLNGRKIAVWGLSFKPKTDDIRESPAVAFINDVTEAGAYVTAYCPKGIENARRELCENARVTFSARKYTAIEGADALALLTEWTDFRNPDFDEVGLLLKQRVIFDGRNIYSRQALEKKGFTVYQIGM